MRDKIENGKVEIVIGVNERCYYRVNGGKDELENKYIRCDYFNVTHCIIICDVI